MFGPVPGNHLSMAVLNPETTNRIKQRETDRKELNSFLCFWVGMFWRFLKWHLNHSAEECRWCFWRAFAIPFWRRFRSPATSRGASSGAAPRPGSIVILCYIMLSLYPDIIYITFFEDVYIYIIIHCTSYTYMHISIHIWYRPPSRQVWKHVGRSHFQWGDALQQSLLVIKISVKSLLEWPLLAWTFFFSIARAVSQCC